MALAGILAASVSAAQTPDSARPDTAPDWLKRPSAADMARLYPPEAMRAGRSGAALIECKLSVDGVLFDCHVLQETPPGMGFGTAALGLTPLFLMKPAQKGGMAVGATIRMPINFKAQGASSGLIQTQSLLTTSAWTEAPTYDDTAAAYPQRARQKNLPGRVSLRCQIKSDGSLSRCETVAEEPKGEGFGPAALALAKHFRAPLSLENGRRTDGMLASLPVTFSLDMLSGARRIGTPIWTRLPAAEDFDTAFQRPAQSVTTKIMMDCGIAAGGVLADCKLESEAPTGLGYGAAAVGLASHFSVSLWTPEGLPTVGGRVQVPIRYEIK